MEMLETYFVEIRQWLQSVKFKRTRFGGVDEADVWKKLDELNSLYEKALIAALAEKESGGADAVGVPRNAKREG